MLFSAIAEEENELMNKQRAANKRTRPVMGKKRDNTGSQRKEWQPRPGALIKGENSPSTAIVDRLLHYYNRQEPPMKDRPTRVRLGIYVNSFYSISEQTMDYSLNFYLRQAWRDPRLAFEATDGIEKIKLEEGKWNEIWIPDTFFRNEKRAGFHSVTVPNRLLKLNTTGHIWYVTKISATLSCPMKLQKYPLDTQMCPMMFESFGYTMDTMYFAWLEDPVQLDPQIELAQFSLEDEILVDCSQNYTAGAFPCLEVRFMLHRDIGFFIIQIYIPSILIVILSWVSFWINIEAIPARVSIGLLTVLATTSQSTGARSSLPRVSYIKAMDVWLSVCLVFVFASLLEFAVVNVMSRKMVRTIKPIDNPGENHNKPKKGIPPPKKIDPAGMVQAERIDRFSRKAFPLAFVLFKVVWWVYYTLPASNPS